MLVFRGCKFQNMGGIKILGIFHAQVHHVSSLYKFFPNSQMFIWLECNESAVTSNGRLLHASFQGFFCLEIGHTRAQNDDIVEAVLDAPKLFAPVRAELCKKQAIHSPQNKSGWHLKMEQCGKEDSYGNKTSFF